LATFAGFLQWHRFGRLLAGLLPAPGSNSALKPVDIAMGFLLGVLAGAKKLSHVAHLRSDPALAPLLQIKRMASQSTLSRFFARFRTAALNLRTFAAILANREGSWWSAIYSPSVDIASRGRGFTRATPSSTGR
jgi:hypothetical protein